MNFNCPDFQGKEVCDFFLSNGACKKPTKFMCHIFMETGKRPGEHDVPLYVGEVLKEFPGSEITEVINFTNNAIEDKHTSKLEDYFGKLNF